MKKEYFVAFLLYLLISLFFLRGIFASPGVIVGNDWGYPANTAQMNQIFQGTFWTWTNEGNLFGGQIFTLNDALIRLFFGLSSLLGIGGELLTKGLALFSLTFVGFAMYFFCRYSKCSREASFLAGLFYVTTPLVFNYLSLGWVYVLLSFALLPIGVAAFEKTVKQRSMGWAVITALIYSLALFQLQALSWFAIVFVLCSIFLVTSRPALRSYLKFLFLVLLLTFLFSSYWILSPLFEQTFQSSVSSFDFGRFGMRLNSLDMLRLWGSLYNFQFETALPRSLIISSFFLPVLAYLALIIKGKNRHVFFFAILSFVPLGIFWAKNILLIIPYSSIFRDYSRNFILSALSYSVLLAFTLDVFFVWFKKVKFPFKFKEDILRLIFIGFWIGINILTAYPFWSGELSKEPIEGNDVRLKTIQFSPEYQRAEDWIYQKKENFKALWLPAGGIVAFKNEPKTAGIYNATWDIFSSYARKPGRITITDRNTKYSRDFAEGIQKNIGADKSPYLSDMLGLINVKYLVVRLNAYSSDVQQMEKVSSKLENDAKFRKVLLDGSVMIFENKNYYPHFYIPQSTVYSDGNMENLPDIMSFGDYEPRPGIFLKNIDELSNSKINELKEKVDQVFIKGELVNKISNEEIDKSLSISLPNVHWMPGDFVYPLILRKEELDKWKVRKEPEKLIEKQLFYASKRIAELEKFGVKDINGLSDYLLTNYKKEMMGAIREIEKHKNREIKKIEKLRTYLKMHRRKIEQTNLDEEIKNKIRDVFDDLEGKIAELEPKQDFSKLVYKFNVPKEEEYDIYVRNIDDIGGAKTDTGNQKLDIRKLETGEDTGNKILEISGRGVETEADNNNWQLLKTKYFPEGEQELVLPFSGISENLIDENLKIQNYRPDSIYKISFDYNAPKGGGFFVAESKGGETARTDLFPTGEKLKHFEKFFKSSSDVADASIHLSISVAEEKNLKVERIYQPEMMLKIINQQLPIIKHQPPKITFVKINPTKYRIKVEGAKEQYPLVFSESFHQGWKAYINEIQNSKFKIQNYYGETVASYFDGEIKEGTHKNIFLDRSTFETWGKKPIPEERHLLVNSYANSWYIIPEDSGGKENYEIIVEFLPQRLFYIGIFISGVILIGCLSYLTLRRIRNRKIDKNVLQSEESFYEPIDKA